MTTCPNCAQKVEGASGHNPGCVLGGLLSVLEDRGHDLSELDFNRMIDPDEFWEMWGGPAADWLAEQLDLAPYPSEPGAKGNDDDRHDES